MDIYDQFPNAIMRLLSDEPILHISGEPGCGKSIMAQTITMHSIAKTGKNAMYIDTVNKFSKNRFLKFFPEPALNERITITSVNSYEQQKFLISKLDRMSRLNMLEEFGLIVIDSISHQLRHEISSSGIFKDYAKAINDFNETQFQPLLLLAKRSNIKIILVHSDGKEIDSFSKSRDIFEIFSFKISSSFSFPSIIDSPILLGLLNFIRFFLL